MEKFHRSIVSITDMNYFLQNITETEDFEVKKISTQGNNSGPNKRTIRELIECRIRANFEEILNFFSKGSRPKPQNETVKKKTKMCLLYQNVASLGTSTETETSFMFSRSGYSLFNGALEVRK